MPYGSSDHLRACDPSFRVCRQVLISERSSPCDRRQTEAGLDRKHDEVMFTRRRDRCMTRLAWSGTLGADLHEARTEPLLLVVVFVFVIFI